MSKKIKIIIVGNGFGGTYTLKNLHKFFHKDPRVEIALIGEKNYFLFTPLLHEVATGDINPENIIEPIRKVFGCCISDFYLGQAREINLANKTIKVGEQILSYDYLVLAPGAETNFYNIPGAEQHTLTLKTLEDAIKIKNHIIDQMERASHIVDREQRKNILNFIIVGGGPTGVELAGELHEFIRESFSKYYKKEIIEDTSITLIQKSSELLPSFGEKMRTKSLEVLKKKKVKVLLNTAVKEVNNSYIILNNNEKIETENVFWVAGIKPRQIKFVGNVLTTSNGRIIVNKYLQLQDHKEIFALGDNAAFQTENKENVLPALAQVAEKEAKILAENIYNIIKNKELKPFVYKSSGSLISLGRWMAIGEILGITFSGGLAWWIWRTVYLSKLISFRKKIKVATDWTLNIFSPRDISEL